MTTQHTPAWALKAALDLQNYYELMNTGKPLPREIDEYEFIEDAQIIAKHAPDCDALLAALSELAEYVDAYEWGRKWAGRPHEIMDAARAAISKAKGQS